MREYIQHLFVLYFERQINGSGFFIFVFHSIEFKTLFVIFKINTYLCCHKSIFINRYNMAFKWYKRALK